MVDHNDNKKPAIVPSFNGDDSQVEVTVIPPTESALHPIVFDAMSPAEVVATVRQLINEYPATSPYSSFILILMTKGSDGKFIDLKEAYDYIELSSCLDEEQHHPKESSSMTAVKGKEEYLEGQESSQQTVAVTVPITLRMELEPYTLHTAKHHVRHVKELLQFPPALADGELLEDCHSNILSATDERKVDRMNTKKQQHLGEKKKKKLDDALGFSSSSSQAIKLLNGSSPQNQVESGETNAEANQQRQPREFVRLFKESAVPVVKDEGLGQFYALGLELALEEVAEPVPAARVAAPEKVGKESDQATFHLNVENGLASLNESQVKCLRWIRPSCWNPPCTQRSLVGDLMYLEVAMLDNIIIHITVTPDGFYVNRTSHRRFDPGPAFNPNFCHELLFTLMRSSSAFSEAWSKAVAQARTRSSQPDVLQNTLIQLVRDGCIDSVTSKPQWNVPLTSKDAPTCSSSYYDGGGMGGGRRNHVENHPLLNDSNGENEEYQSFGIIDKSAPRDWSDELQGVKDWDSSSHDRRIIQARAMHKILQEFHAEAIKGAIAIVAGHVLPFNCPKSEEMSVFVFNNIFFSYAVDTGEGYKVVSGPPAVWKSLGRDLRNSACLLGMNCRGINTVATAIVDYRGRRVVAQGIIPGILRSDNQHVIVLGAIEKGQRIKSNPDALELCRSIGKVFHIAERDVPTLPIPSSSVVDSNCSSSHLEEDVPDSISTEEDGADTARRSFDGDTSSVPLCGPVEMKCLVGTDGRRYLLEVLRLTPRDANWVRGEKGTGVYGDMAPPRDEMSHIRLTIEDVAVLRPELISDYVKLLLMKQQLMSDRVKKIEEPVFNVNVFTPFTGCTDSKQLLHDEEHARAAAKFLWDVVLSRMTSEIRHGRFVPSDGVHLCEQLHNQGINLRYMGQLAQLALKEELNDGAMSPEAKHVGVNLFPVYWREMLEVEIVARASKHIFFELLSASPSARMAPGPTVRRFLNCLVGNGSVARRGSSKSTSSTPSYSKNNGRKKKGNNSNGSILGFGDVLYKAVVANSDMTHNSLWDELREEIQDRYRYSIKPLSSSSGVRSREASLQLLRRTCQRIGARVLSKQYDFEAAEPLGTWDVVDLVPTSKTCQPSTPFQEASDTWSEAQVDLEKGKLQTAFDLVNRAAGAMQQVCCGMHRMYADILHCQGLVLYHANNIEAAIVHEQKALAFYQQVEGFDSHKVIMCHRHLSVFYASLDFSVSPSYRVRAIAHARALCYLAELLGGKRHPEVSATYQHLGRLYMDLGRTAISMKCFEEALKRERDANMEAHLHHYLAKVLAMCKLFKDALKQQKEAWSIWHCLYGDLHPKTQEATAYLEHYTSSAVCHEKNLVDTLRTDHQLAAAEVIKPLGTQVKLTKKMKKKKKKEEGAAAATTSCH